MAGSQEQMERYIKILLEHTKQQGVPVTEIISFKLKESASEATTVESETTLTWMMDWEKIEDHCDFWQTDKFLPVMAGTSRLFVEGRPLVGHYKFEPMGLLHNEFVRVVIWDEREKATVDEVRNEKTLGHGYLERKGGVL
ncbi:hypothetical protein B0J14DRAFT_669673 [Halenospora varia]|nr:hypothetical protein B0J14DRAFT_669673 [Halenospora varia]